MNILIPIISSLLGVIIGAWLAFRYQKKTIVRTEVKELRNRLIFIKSNLEAYEYILLAITEDLHYICYRYALKYTRNRLSHLGDDLNAQELADRLESTREKYELKMFDFRKLISEFKSLSNEHKPIERIMSPFINEDYDKWNKQFNRIELESELLEYEKLNNEDIFGQGGKSIEPSKTISEKKELFATQFSLLYELADKHILKLQPKD